jgi:FKBP12-rapamycin complex-associated protein
LTQAWDLYYHVFRRISKQLPQLTSLELQYVSPKLLKCRDLELAVPGSYNPGQELIRISSIQTNLQVKIVFNLIKAIELFFKKRNSKFLKNLNFF